MKTQSRSWTTVLNVDPEDLWVTVVVVSILLLAVADYSNITHGWFKKKPVEVTKPIMTEPDQWATEQRAPTRRKPAVAGWIKRVKPKTSSWRKRKAKAPVKKKRRTCVRWKWNIDNNPVRETYEC